MGANGSTHNHNQPNFDRVKYLGIWWVLGRYGNSKEPKYKTQLGDNIINPETGRVDMNITNILVDGTKQTMKGDHIPTDNPVVTYFGMVGAPMDQRSKDIVHYTDYDNFAISGGGPGSDSLWILSRSPATSYRDARMLADKAASFGYDKNKIEFHDFNLTK